MTATRIVVVGLLFGALAIGREDDPATRDQAALQGTWDVVQMVVGGKDQARQGAKVVVKNDFLILGLDGSDRAFPLRFVLTPAKTPSEIDFAVVGPAGQGLSRLPGIYELTADRLKLCVAQGEQAPVRPAGFASKEGSKDLLLILKRR